MYCMSLWGSLVIMDFLVGFQMFIMRLTDLGDGILGRYVNDVPMFGRQSDVVESDSDQRATTSPNSFTAENTNEICDGKNTKNRVSIVSTSRRGVVQIAFPQFRPRIPTGLATYWRIPTTQWTPRTINPWGPEKKFNLWENSTQPKISHWSQIVNWYKSVLRTTFELCGIYCIHTRLGDETLGLPGMDEYCEQGTVELLFLTRIEDQWW